MVMLTQKVASVDGVLSRLDYAPRAANTSRRRKFGWFTQGFSERRSRGLYSTGWRARGEIVTQIILRFPEPELNTGSEPIFLRLPRRLLFDI